MKRGHFVIILLVSCLLFMMLKIHIDSMKRAKVPGASILYIPSGEYLKVASLGYSSFLADMIYIWSIQYFSNPLVPDRFQHLDHVYTIIAELDPRFLDPYEVGALIAVYDARDPDKAFRILDRGLEKNPDQWIFPFIAGHYAQMTIKDFDTARRYYEKTMAIEGAPAMARRLYANAAYELSDYSTALSHWVEIYETADDKRIRKIASNHIYRTKAAIEIEAIKDALEKYKSRFGRFPDKLDLLVSAGLLRSIPQDMDGNDFVYDPETGEVTTAISPWKRVSS